MKFPRILGLAGLLLAATAFAQSADESGATAIEYGLIAALIAVAVIGGVSTLGSNANDTFTTISNQM